MVNGANGSTTKDKASRDRHEIEAISSEAVELRRVRETLMLGRTIPFMRILVAGGAGFIGSVLVPHLLEAGHDVAVLDRFYFGPTLDAVAAKYGDKLSIFKDDIRTFEPKTVLSGVEAVVDLAGISNDPSCDLEAHLTESINIAGGKRLASLARQAGVRRYVYTSSCSVYGHGAGLGLTENSPRHPVSLYARAKCEVEDYALQLGRESGGGFESVALRLATVFGVSPRMRFDLAVNVMTKNAYVHRKVSVEGGGKQWRPFVHVTDVARAMHLAATADASRCAGRIFNVGSGENNVQIAQLAYRVRDAVPSTELVSVGTDPDLRDYNVTFDAIGESLDYRTTRTIDDGIQEVLAALRSGKVDPDDRRAYTLRQYVFLREAELTAQSLAMHGHILGTA